VERLTGFDTAGEPFISGDRVLRGIYHGQAASVREVLQICEREKLFDHGIVSTRELAENPHPEIPYEMVLEHRRLPFVSYPHEWSGSMFKDAALFHIQLFERLEKHGLTLKDWHPYNILFDSTSPVFVDFTSIIPIRDLASQPHLLRARAPGGMSGRWDKTSLAVYEMYRGMYDPYFGLPLAMMHRRRHAVARRRLFETTLNAADTVITRREAFEGDVVGRLRYELDERILRNLLAQKGPAKPGFFAAVRRAASRRKAALEASAYSSYYEDKNEAFSPEPSARWTAKQHGVHNALRGFSPATVLDLGSNTGWFSMLAARLGSSVVAVDLDEASIDRLYSTAKREQLGILPLVANLTEALPELAPNTFEDEPSQSLLGEAPPLIRSAPSRLRCEMVLALAIVHHLALGQGLRFDEIASILGGLADKYLCVEFVDIDDAMITDDPDFFPALKASPDGFAWYAREEFMRELRRYFGTIKVVPSHPGSRSLLVCSKQ